MEVNRAVFDAVEPAVEALAWGVSLMLISVGAGVTIKVLWKIRCHS